jgi:hypothetical protein
MRSDAAERTNGVPLDPSWEALGSLLHAGELALAVRIALGQIA